LTIIYITRIVRIMKGSFTLFIDETGNANPLSKQSNSYILCGCAVPNSSIEELKIKADQIKFKYWGRTDIVFHSEDIGNNSKEFSIFANNRAIKAAFIKDLFAYLRWSPITMFIIVVDKSLATSKGWNHVKVVKETSKTLIYHFITWVLSAKSKGKIVIEASEKDVHYLKNFNYFLSPGAKELSVDYTVIQNTLTSISFVTKKNHDVEEQIADILAYAARCKFLQDFGTRFAPGTYENKIISILEYKLFNPPTNAGSQKSAFYQQIEPFCILPK
jgi:hypothetical protein